MGILIPPKPRPPSGWACPITHMTDMSWLYLSINGVKFFCGGTLHFMPNGLHLLLPYASCGWRKFIRLDPTHSVVLAVNYYFGWIDVVVGAAQPPYVIVYEYSHFGFPLTGENQAGGCWRGGNHQIAFAISGAPASLTDLSLDLAISDSKKVFAELYGCEPARSKGTRRFAGTADHTCVYIKGDV